MLMQRPLDGERPDLPLCRLWPMDVRSAGAWQCHAERSATFSWRLACSASGPRCAWISVGQHGYHWITIDPAASDQAIGSHAKVGFRAAGAVAGTAAIGPLVLAPGHPQPH